jgi:hypothetical protein
MEVPRQEIAPSLFSGLMLPDFVDPTIHKRQPQPLYRLDQKDKRYYYSLDESGVPTFFTSVTTLIQQTLPTSPHLIKWIADMGHEEAKEYAKDKAYYGEFLHIQCGTLLKERKYDLTALRPLLEQFMKENNLPQKFINYEDSLKKDILAFAKFCIDHKVRPVAIEMVLSHPKNGYAGAIDLVCFITVHEQGFFGEKYKTGVNKGKPKKTKGYKRILVIIDIKSGRKGVYESAEIQLGAYRNLWNYHFKDLRVHRIFNWSPKDWRGTDPTYSLVEQTNKKSLKKLTHLVKLAQIEKESTTSRFLLTSGVIDLEVGLEDNIETKTLEDIVRRDDIINEKQ